MWFKEAYLCGGFRTPPISNKGGRNAVLTSQTEELPSHRCSPYSRTFYPLYLSQCPTQLYPFFPYTHKVMREEKIQNGISLFSEGLTCLPSLYFFTRYIEVTIKANRVTTPHQLNLKAFAYQRKPIDNGKSL